MNADFNEVVFCKMILDDGLETSMTSLEEKLSSSCKLLDACGYSLYPEADSLHEGLIHTEYLSEPDLEIPKSLNDLPSGSYDYDPTRKTLCFAIGKTGSRGYVIVEIQNNDEIEPIVSILSQTVLGFTVYLSSYYHASKKQHDFEDNAFRYLFSSGSANLVTFARDLGINVDVNQLYMVSILSIEDISGTKVHREYIRNVTIEYFNKRSEECLVSIDDDKLILMLPQQNKRNQFEVNDSWLPRQYYRELNDIIESKYPVRINSGIGQPKSVKKIHESYREALIALTIPKILGEKHYAQFYDDLGAIAVIFSNCYNEYKEYTLTTLQKLFEYDYVHNIHLFDTLTTLIGNNCNRKETAEKMYIHVNTLKYRINKIEELLNIDMNDLFDLAQLYQTVLFYFTIKENGWLES